MGRAFKVELRSNGVAVIVDYSALHELTGLGGLKIDEASRAIVSGLIEKCLSRYPTVKRQSVLYMEVLCRGASKYDYGVIERCVDEYERSLRSKFAARRHVFFTFFTDKPLTEIEVAIYRVVTPISKPYEVLGKLCRLIAREYGHLAERLSKSQIAFPISGGEELPEALSFNVNGLAVEMSYDSIKRLDPSSPREADCLKRLLSRALKISLRSKGYVVKGQRAYWRGPAIEDERVEVRRGFEFSVLVFSDGEAALALSPKSEVSSRLTLWEEYGRSYDSLIKSSRDLHGRAAKRIYNGATIRIMGIEETRVCESSGHLMSVLERYGAQGVLRGFQVSIDEPVVVGLLRGEEVREAPSMLKLIYTLKDLKKMGATDRIVKFLHSPPQTWLEAARDFIRSIGSLDIGGETINFIDEPPEVELL